MKYAIFAFIVLIVTAAGAVAQCSSADKAALIKFDKDWSATNASGDRKMIEAIYADEFTAIPAMTGKGAAVDGAVAAFERNKANPQAVATTVTDHYMITCTPLSAAIVHRNVTTPASGGPPNYGQSVHFVEKRNGKWVAVSNAAGGPLSDRDMIRYMELDWLEAMKNRNYDWMEKNIAADFTEVSFMSGEVVGKRQMIDGFKADKTVFESMEVSDLNIRIDGNTAIATGVGHGRGKMGDGKPFDIKLRFTDTFVKRDGRWLAWASQATMIPQKEMTAAK